MFSIAPMRPPIQLRVKTVAELENALGVAVLLDGRAAIVMAPGVYDWSGRAPIRVRCSASIRGETGLY